MITKYESLNTVGWLGSGKGNMLLCFTGARLVELKTDSNINKSIVFIETAVIKQRFIYFTYVQILGSC